MGIDDPKIITQDPQFQQILEMVNRVSGYGSTILISGESGTGKDLIARLIHKSSPRLDQAYIKVDCASIPEELTESELFGHEIGAFTGAVMQRIGRFEMAHNGTIFLDQIGDLPPQIQSKLTRILQEKQFERVGGNETISTDVRIISASRIPLDNLVKRKLFRKDLYFRLSIVPIHLPPLRNRRGDIPLLAKHFLEYFAGKYHVSLPKLHPNALEFLCCYYWPGNVRELENLMERLIVCCSDRELITTADIPIQIESFDDQTLNYLAEKSMSLAEIEKLYIQKILVKEKGNKSRAARILGINRKTLLEKRRRYLLD